MAIVKEPILKVDLTSRAHRANPYPLYARLRAEAPVCSVTLPDGQKAWLAACYDDVVTVLKDARFAKDRTSVLTPEQTARLPWVPRAFKPLERNMLDVDESDHTRLRGLVHKAFTPRLIENLREGIQRLTHELLDAVAAKGRMDLIRDFALPLPATVIAEMLGVPVQDRHKFHRWTNILITSTPNAWGRLMMIPPVMAFLRYIRKLAKAREAEPRDDLISALVLAREEGDRLSEDELLAMVFLLLVAGHETTVNLIGNGVLALLQHPEQMDRLRNDRGLIKTAVEEMLRYDAPVGLASERYAREELTIGGVTLPRGAMLLPVLASANRDETQFDRPDTFDIAREPNRHVSFGLGAHYCLGASLARMEGQIAIDTLLERAPNLRLAAPHSVLRWRPGLSLRGLRTLPVVFA